MSDRLVWYLNDRDPSILETATVDGTAQDISLATSKKLKMREVGASTLKVNANCSFVTDGTDGELRYDWAAGDLDTAGQYLVWWEITLAGKVQTIGEAIIEVRAHTALDSYIELEEFKETAELDTTTYADGDIKDALEAGSRYVDAAAGTRFKQADETRVYTAPYGTKELPVDPVVAVTGLSVDTNDDGVYETSWVEGTDYVLGPANADVDGRPFTRIELLDRAGRRFPTGQRAIEIEATFGWPAVPPQVRAAVKIVANQILIRVRQAPFAIASVVGAEMVAAARIGRVDPTVKGLLDQLPGVRQPSRSVRVG